MVNKLKKTVLLTGLFLLILGLAFFTVILGSLTIPKTEAFTPHYLVCQGTTSRIYLVSTASSYTVANQSYFSTVWSEVPKESSLFMIKATLRNDYSSDNPPPSMGTQVTPVDGTAYIYLNASLHTMDGTVNAINVSPSDFASPTSDQTGLVLASGQTNTVNFFFSTNQTAINKYEINLVSISDSITR